MPQSTSRRLVTEAALQAALSAVGSTITSLSQIANSREDINDIVAAMFPQGVYTDNGVEAGTITLPLTSGGGSTPFDPEVVRDTIAAALVAGSGVSINANDASDTITISATPGLTTLTYANAMPGSTYRIIYAAGWPTTRPSSRTDIYFHLIGGSKSIANPGWMLDGDNRSYTAA
jgi:hypothetical protein